MSRNRHQKLVGYLIDINNLIKINNYFLEKIFSFLSPDEIEKLKEEEDQKLASLSHEINSWSNDDNDDDNVDFSKYVNFIYL